MSDRSGPVLTVATATALAAALLVFERGGVIAWATLAFALVLAVKAWRRPAPRDLLLALTLAVVAVVGWVGTRHYVISTWESGEVVELAIEVNDETHIARLWVLDVEADPIVYYDAAPEVARALLAGQPLKYTRAGAVSQKLPRATRVTEMPEKETADLFNAMNDKYGALNNAATLYYVLLGRPRDRIDVVVRLADP